MFVRLPQVPRRSLARVRCWDPKVITEVGRSCIRIRITTLQPHDMLLLLLSAAQLSTFLQWCSAQAGITSPLSVAQQQGDKDHNRYTTATRDIAAGEPLVQVPLSSCLVAESQAALAARLTAERQLDRASFFAPWMDVLPGAADVLDHNHFPRFWSSKRLALVTASDDGCLQAALDERIQQEQNAGDDIDPWAWAMVRSRCNYLPVNSKNNQMQMQYAMTPLLDMINHDPAVRTTAQVVVNEQTPCLELRTPHVAYNAGDEVTISYGPLTNVETLADYGFVTPGNNPYNVETVTVPPFVGQATPVRIAVQANGSMDDLCLAPLRQALATAAEHAVAAANNSDAGYYQALSTRNEMEVGGLVSAALYDAVERAQEGAAATIDDDAVVHLYLTERAKTLTAALQRVDAKLEAAL